MAVAVARPAPAALRIKRPPLPVCTFWLQGCCNRSRCRFLHPPLPAAAPGPEQDLIVQSSHKPQVRRILRRPIFTATEGGAEDTAVRVHAQANPQQEAASHRGTLRTPAFKAREGGEAEVAPAAAHDDIEPQLPVQQERASCVQESPTTDRKVTLLAHLAGHPGSCIRGITLPRLSTTLYTAGHDGFLRGWDGATGLCTQFLWLGQPANCLFNSFDDSDWLFVGLATEVRVVNLATNTQQILPVRSPVCSLTSFGDHLLAGLEQGSILVWRFDAASATFVMTTASLSPPDECLSAVLTLEPTSKILLAGYADGTIRVWDANTGECMDMFRAHHGAITQILTCGLDWVLSASHADGKVALWRICDGMQTGSVVAAASDGEDHHVLELLSTHIVHAEEQCLRPLVMCGLFDNDNTPILFVSYNDTTVRILEVPSFTERGILHNDKPVEAMEIGAQHLLVLGSKDGSLTTWAWCK